MEAATAAARLEAKYCSSEKLALLLSLKTENEICVNNGVMLQAKVEWTVMLMKLSSQK